MEQTTFEKLKAADNRISQLIEKIESQIADIAAMDDSALLQIVEADPALAAKTLYEQACVIDDLVDCRRFEEQIHCEQLAESEDKVSEAKSKALDARVRSIEADERCNELIRIIKGISQFLPENKY